MSPYQVMVDDNFHYGDEDERSEYGIYPTAEEALAICRKLVDAALLAEYRDGQTAEALFERYSSFGDDPSSSRLAVRRGSNSPLGLMPASARKNLPLLASRDRVAANARRSTNRTSTPADWAIVRARDS